MSAYDNTESIIPFIFRYSEARGRTKVGSSRRRVGPVPKEGGIMDETHTHTLSDSRMDPNFCTQTRKGHHPKSSKTPGLKQIFNM